jgi:hypothetical protein
MTLDEKEFTALIALLAQVEATGKVNDTPTLGLFGAEEAFFTIQEFVSQLEKARNK